MPDWDLVNGMAEEYGFGDPDMDVHDPAGHCGKTPSSTPHRSSLTAEHPRSIAKLVCRNCGAATVFWADVGGVMRPKWRLHDKATGRLHVCQMSPHEFDDLTLRPEAGTCI